MEGVADVRGVWGNIVVCGELKVQQCLVFEVIERFGLEGGDQLLLT